MASVKRGFQQINGVSVPYTALVRKSGAVHLLRAGKQTWHWKKAPTVPSWELFETSAQLALSLASSNKPAAAAGFSKPVTEKAVKAAVAAAQGQTKDYKMDSEPKVVGVIRGHSRTGERITALLFNDQTVQLKRLGEYTFTKGGRFPAASFLSGHGVENYELTGR